MNQDTVAPKSEPVPWQRKGLERLKWASMAYALALSLLLVSVPLGLAPAQPVLLICALVVLTSFVCHALLVNGKLGPRHDPMWVFPQVMLGFLVVALSFAYVPWCRPVASAWLFVVLLFDLRRLNRWQTGAVALLWAAIPIWSVWIHQQAGDPHFVLNHELVFTVLSLILMPSLFWISALSRRLIHRLHHQQAQMNQVLARLKRLSSLDALTGLYNRSAMQRILQREVLRTRRNHLPFAVAMIDLDHFKHINDRFGHAVGDEVLRQFGDLARGAARVRTDAIGRWGGEEFLLFLPATTEAEAVACVERLRQAVSRHAWFRLHPKLNVTFSAGVCAHHRHSSLDATVARADQALYQAKAQGRDQTVQPPPVEPPRPSQKVEQRPVTHPVQASTAWSPPATALTAPKALDDGWMLGESPPTSGQRQPHRSLWERWLFGPDESLRHWIQLSLTASGLYVSLILAFCLYGIPSGLVTPQWGHLFVTVDAFAAGVPFLLVRSGIAKKWRDPGLTLSQILLGCSLCALAFVVIPPSRAYDLQLLCITLVFGLNYLRARQAMFAGTFVSIVFVIIYLVQTHAALTRQDNLTLRMQLLMAAAVIWLLTLQMRRHCTIRQNVSAEKRRLLMAMEQLRTAIKFDPLTQLFNRQHMSTLLEDETLRHERTGSGFCVALLDLDHFKSINDQLGHQAGDQVLKRFAACAKAFLRETDTLGRWGGEEFVLLMPDTHTPTHSLRACERLREWIESQDLIDPLSGHRVTFSAGLAIHQRGETIQTLLSRADNALYVAKEQGRNRCVLSPNA